MAFFAVAFFAVAFFAVAFFAVAPAAGSASRAGTVGTVRVARAPAATGTRPKVSGSLRTVRGFAAVAGGA